MQHSFSGAVRRRAATLWTVVSVAMAGLGALAGPAAHELLRSPGTTFADLLVQACAAAALLAGAVLWLATTDVTLRVLSARPPSRRLGPLRTALLTACGVAALAATTPASATPPDGPEPTGAALLHGLPLPDRALGGPPSAVSDGAPPDRERVRATVLVRPGDSLWSIAARATGAGASEAEVAAYWQRLKALNAPATGGTPDLVHPGQRLDLPPR